MKISDLDWVDIADRCEWTFAQSFLAVAAGAGTGFVSIKVWESAALAGGAAVLSLLKNTFFQTRAAKKAAK